MALSLVIDGVERVSVLMSKSLSVTNTKDVFEGRCDFTLKNLIPAILQSVLITDGATTYFDGFVSGINLSEIKAGAFYCGVSAHDAHTPAAAAIAPFALSDQTDEATYLDLMTGTNTTLGGWSDPSIWVPYAWWRLGEASGAAAAVDEMGVQVGGYAGSPTLGVAGPMGTGNTAATFNGTSQYVTCGVAHLAGQADFSIAAWAKTSSATSQVIYSERAASGIGAWVMFLIDANGRPALMYKDDAGTSDTIVPTSGDWSDGAWHHFAVAKDGTAVKLYVDGVLIHSGALTANDTLTGLQAAIAADASVATFFNGSLDEVQIWRDALDVIMVRQAYAMRDVRPYHSLTVAATYSSSTTPSIVTTATVSTFHAGLAPGQLLAITSANYGMHAIELDVQELTVRWVNAATPLYTAKCGDYPLRLAAAFP